MSNSWICSTVSRLPSTSISKGFPSSSVHLLTASKRDSSCLLSICVPQPDSCFAGGEMIASWSSSIPLLTPRRSTNRLRQTKGWAAPVRLSSRKNRSNGGKTVQAQHCSIRYGERNGLKTRERNRVSNRATSYGDTGCPKAPSRCNRTTNAFWRSDNRASDFRMELRLVIGKEHCFIPTISLRPKLEAKRYG